MLAARVPRRWGTPVTKLAFRRGLGPAFFAHLTLPVTFRSTFILTCGPENNARIPPRWADDGTGRPGLGKLPRDTAVTGVH